jgi:O-antigen ligase
MLGTVALVLWLLIQVDAVFPRVQMFFLGGQAPLPGAVLRLALFSTFIATLMVRHQLKIPLKLAIAILVFAAYLCFRMTVITRFNLGLLDNIYSSYLYYFPLLLLPLIFTLAGTLLEEKVVRWILVAFVPLALFGILQNIRGLPMLSVSSSDENFSVIAWGYPGYVRGFSLFGSGLSFGHYLALVAPLLLVLFYRQKRGRNRFGMFILFAIALLAVYTTLTRLVFLWVGAALIFTAIFLWLPKSIRLLLTIVPFIFGGVGIFVAVVLPRLLNKLSLPIFSNASLNLRLEQWNILSDLWLGEQNLLTLLFGLGLFQTNNKLFSQDIVLDNVYLAIGVHAGLVGLVLCISLLWWVWSYCLNNAILRNSPLSIAAAASTSAWLLAGLYNIEIESFILVIMLVIWTTPYQVQVFNQEKP